MTRRPLLLLPFLPGLRAADAERQVFDLFATLASRLSEGDAAGFLDGFDKSMPGYEELRANVAALVLEAEIQSSIEFERNEGTATARSVELDWFVQLVGRSPARAVTRRRELVKCRVEKSGKRWKVRSLEPRSLFAAIGISAG